MNLVKIKASDFGLEEVKAKQIEEQFKPMLEEMTALEKEYNEIIKLEINEETCLLAKNLRLRYVRVRTATAAVHKKQKAFYLAGGRFVDGWKNAQKFASEGMEENLMKIEKHFENLEKEKIEKLQLERAIELEKYEVEIIPGNLGEMPEEVWKNYLFGTKINYENQKAAEKKAEDERIENERIQNLHNVRYQKIVSLDLWQFRDEWLESECLGDLTNEKFKEVCDELSKKKADHEEEQERIRLDNERLRKEAEEKEKQRKAEEAKRLEAEKKRLAAEEKKRQAAAKKLQKAEEERKKLEKQLEEKRLAEERERQEAEEARQAELNKDDQQKFNDFIAELKEVTTKYSFKSDIKKEIYADISGKINEILKEHLI
jgi:hypothetical protein